MDGEPKTKIARLKDTTETSKIKGESAAIKPSNSFTSPWHLSDVVLIVEGRKFHVHKCILSMNSPFFDRMFSSDFKEKSAKEIKLPKKSAKEFEELLKMIYNDHKTSMITYNNFEFLLKLAQEYQMDKIKKCCDHYMKLKLSKENCLHFCQVADQYDLSDELKRRCVKEAKWLPLSAIEESTHFVQMSSTSPTLDNQILIEKIKLLEEFKEILDSYYKTCCDLVKSIYCSAATTVNHTIACYSSDHPPEEQISRFIYDCESCTHWLEENWPSRTTLYGRIKPDTDILLSLARKYKSKENEKSPLPWWISRLTK
ncbi:BTB and MATH domain-containing protein 36-like [Exaiptasia diaphana]|uniref:BTB domain-containing protein n=1 Tax=Exaiptasia diaphana TaxID=2652724 RepID=A0A913Y4U5_EXADI|nr:BTB and MATH domain-containing protein 36-like [Exaiptasia diaphana]XP_020914753.1 BTB and MATH domain-containing protein 36-like [Exaiptasia diaphana]